MGALLLAFMALNSQLADLKQLEPSQSKQQPAVAEPLPAQGEQSLTPLVAQVYSAPASTDPRNSCHLFVTASYLYWYAGEDGLDLATRAAFDADINTVTASANRSHTIFQDFSYTSGFKVGLGYFIHRDAWVLRADYTRLHQVTEKSVDAHNTEDQVGSLFTTNWFYQTSDQGQNLAGTHLSSRWHLQLDWLDLALQRPFYSGQSLTLNPFIGLRASWIDQSLRVALSGAQNFTPPNEVTHSHNKQSSWALGPRLGVDAHYLLGGGVRIQGAVGGSLLYTRYVNVSHSEDAIALGSHSVSYSNHDLNSVRLMSEANLGMGWGIYFCNNRCHFDLSATYDFNYLWAQNMMRALNDTTLSRVSPAQSDLFLHGLTLTAAFNF